MPKCSVAIMNEAKVNFVTFSHWGNWFNYPLPFSRMMSTTTDVLLEDEGK